MRKDIEHVNRKGDGDNVIKDSVRHTANKIADIINGDTFKPERHEVIK